MAETLGFPVPLRQRFRPLSITCPGFLTTCGAGVLAPGQARDPRRAGDPRPPVRVEAAVHLEDLDAPVLLAAVPAAVDRLEPVGRLPLGAQRDQGVRRARLVVLPPPQGPVAGRGRDGEGFFGSAGRRR